MLFFRLALRLLAAAVVGGSAICQELGPIERFGADGRLFSSGGDDYFLLSRQRYVSEDSSGYEGQVRIVKKYPNGGYEIHMRDYIARCVAPFDKQVYVVWAAAGEMDSKPGEPISITNPESLPNAANKESYNLYWAACHNQFRKFK
jgi:hypothetical protein